MSHFIRKCVPIYSLIFIFSTHITHTLSVSHWQHILRYFSCFYFFFHTNFTFFHCIMVRVCINILTNFYYNIQLKANKFHILQSNFSQVKRISCWFIPIEWKIDEVWSWKEKKEKNPSLEIEKCSQEIQHVLWQPVSNKKNI